MVDSVDTPCILMGVTDNFNTRVLENSAQGPVLVNFWSSKAMLRIFIIVGHAYPQVAEYRLNLHRYTH